jgi:hypothetical protein
MGGNVARALVPALVVLALVALVAIAATGSTPAGSGDTRRPSYVLFDTIFSLSLVAMLASAAFLVYVLAHRGPRDYPRTRGGLASFVALAALVALLATLDVRTLVLSEPSEVEEPPVTGVIPNTSENGAEHADRPEFAWLPVTIILVLVAIGVTTMLLAKRRRRAREKGRKAAEEAIVDVLEDTLDDLRRERDPRRAVIAAYARLERALAAHGLPRGSAETQTEYVARILDELDVDRAAVRRLTDLFSRAKFSQHAVDIPMKEEAIDALEHVRDELREAAAREEAPEAELVTTGASS